MSMVSPDSIPNAQKRIFTTEGLIKTALLVLTPRKRTGGWGRAEND